MPSVPSVSSLRLPASLKTRLVLSHVLVSLISIVLISSYAANSIYSAARKEIENNLEDILFSASNALEGALQDYFAGSAEPSPNQLTLASGGVLALLEERMNALLLTHPEVDYTLYSREATPLMSNNPAFLDAGFQAAAGQAPEVLEALSSALGEGERIRSNEKGQQTLYIAQRIEDEGKTYGALRLGITLKSALETTRRNLGLLLLGAGGVMLAVSLFGWFLADTLTRPIQNLTRAATQLASGKLETRVSPGGARELSQLAEAFNQMAGGLQTHVRRLQTFVANASHELRTPLTIVKLRVEALRQGASEDPELTERFLGDIESEVDRLARMVSDLLDLSRIEAGLAYRELTPLDLGAIASEVYESFALRAERAGLKMSLTVQPGLPAVMGDESQIHRVLYNFLDNAIKYTPRGGRVKIYAQAGVDENGLPHRQSVRLMVKDSGPGITPEHLPHVFERFYRIEATRPQFGAERRGSGLGLAIAKSIVESHGGQIGASSQPGQGASFWADLPALESSGSLL